MKDFFTTYHHSHVRRYIGSGLLALVLSLSFVTLMNQTGSQQMLLANVLMAGSSETVSYSADLMMTRSGTDLSLSLGKDAYDVDMISLTIIGDPERFLSLQSNDPRVHIASHTPGVSLVTLRTERVGMRAGEVFTTLHATLSGSSILTATDPLLTSMGQIYTLSVQSK